MEAATPSLETQNTQTTEHKNTAQQAPDFEKLYNAADIRELAQEAKLRRDTALNEALQEGQHAFNAKIRARNAHEEVINSYVSGYFDPLVGALGDEVDKDRTFPPYNYERSAAAYDIKSLLHEKGVNLNRMSKKLARERTDEYASLFESQADEEDSIKPTSPEEQATEGAVAEEITQPSIEIDPYVEAHETNLNNLRAKMATLTAKRQSRLYTGKKLTAEFETLQAQYNDQMQKFGRLKLADVIDDESVPDEEKNKQVIAYIFKQQEALRTETLEALSNQKLRKSVEWFAKGNALQRIGKGAILGFAAAGAAAGIGALAGVAGAAAVGAGVGAVVVGGARFARAFAISEARAYKKQGNKDTPSVSMDTVDASDDADIFDTAQTYFDAQLEKDIDKEQTKRLKSVAAGLGGVALGAGLGFVAQAALDAGVFNGFMNRSIVGDVGATPVEGGAPVGDAVDQQTKDMLDQNTSDAGDAAVEVSTPEISYDPAFSIEPGEGGIAFFQSIGLSEADWYTVHQELLANFPQDFYSEYGDTRLVHSGQLSLEAQQFIKTRFSI